METTDDLVYDMTLEVQGIVRSIVLRTRLDRELGVGETFDLRGRRWRVSTIDRVNRNDLDRRVIARQVEDADLSLNAP
jgi:hypothetical protein